jgi:hypothetical protein
VKTLSAYSVELDKIPDEIAKKPTRMPEGPQPYDFKSIAVNSLICTAFCRRLLLTEPANCRTFIAKRKEALWHWHRGRNDWR